ncbi:MAG TPA: metallophosphoesterase [Acetobacteraceae bacterium]|nr:metallophosphoesterase [Acetobacteraceae bacterium]
MPRRPTSPRHHADPADPSNQPAFAQPEPTPDPTKFRIRHASDTQAYRTIDELNREHRLFPLPFPAPRGGTEPRLTLAAVLGARGPEVERAITASGQLVFHSVGDTGSTRGPETQNRVADKMLADFDEASAAEVPQFFLHLGDVVYNFGEAQYYYDQFYDPYRDYPAPVVALAGNHDGMVVPNSGAEPLAAWLENFCAAHFETTPEAGGLLRTAQIEPGVFFTFEAPFLRVLALYSGTLEDPGVIADEHVGQSQLDYLAAALARAREENYAGALIVAHHHPTYTAGTKHGWSIAVREQIDAACTKAGIWPHAVLSGHAHNYQRFTRTVGGRQIPYLVAGGGGHALARLSRRGELPTRSPVVVEQNTDGSEKVVLENYDDLNYGYLRIVATAARLRIEFHPASDGADAKTPDDAVTVDLKSGKIVGSAA